MLKKIWNDPVGSNVIAWAIIGVISLIGIVIKSIFSQETFFESLIWFINYPIKVFILFIGVTIILLTRWLLKRNNQFYNSKQRRLRKFNHSIDQEAGIRTEWTVYFGMNGKPFISDLEFYCLNHGEVPIRLFGNRCSYTDCKNFILKFNEHEIKNYFESLVLNEWNKINRN